ncbi:FAD-dependent oxidoreductase, partial [Paenibacillus sp. TAF58]
GEAEWEKAWSGLRPQTTDGLPYIGKVPAHEGLYAACGHYRNGILLSPITGKVIADFVLGGGEENFQPELELGFELGLGIGTEIRPERRSERGSGIGYELGPETGPGTGMGIRTETRSGTGTEIRSVTRSGISTETGAETRSETGTLTCSAMESLLDAFSPDLSGQSKRMGRREGNLFSAIGKEAAQH